MPTPPFSTHEPPRWDPWILAEDDSYRLFYLSGRTDQDPWWKTSWICGGHSSDLQHWQHTGPVLEPTAEAEWESGRIFAGSAYKQDGLYYLFYSAASEADIAEEAIGLATSADGVSWVRSPRPLLSWADAKGIQTAAGVGYAGRCSWDNHLHWRDPYVVKQSEKYYLFFCTSLTQGDRYQGGLGVAVADSLNGPYQLLPPGAGPGISTDADWPFYHLERPQVVFFQGQYHLFFSCFKEAIDPVWLNKLEMNGSNTEKISDSTLYWYVSEEITGPFRPVGELPVVPGSETTGLYGTTFFPLEARGDWSQIDSSDRLEMTVLG